MNSEFEKGAMVMKMRRYLSVVLIIALIIGCFAGTVFAAQEDATAITPVVDYMPDPRQPDVYVPPVYYGDSTETPVPDVYYTNIEDAAAEVRAQLEDRVDYIYVGYRTSSSDYDKRLEVFNEALVHTGVPTQGDYLAYQHGAYRYGYSGYTQNGVNYITFTYEMTYYTTAHQEQQMDTAVDTLLDTLDVYDASDYEKISTVYDYMCENIVYDYDGLDLENATNSNKKIYSAYAALIDGTAVCQGYANLFYRLMLELGVDSRIISGIGNGGPHAWNIVELNDLYYDVDATWDAPRKEAGSPYDYFLRCEENFGDHTRESDFTTTQFLSDYPMSSDDYYYTVASGTCGANATWTLDSNYHLTISGSGAITTRPCESYYHKVKSMTIEPGITDIGNQVFSNYISLEKVTIPASVTFIDFGGFFYCNSLQTVIYRGTQSQWKAITIDSYNDAVLDAEILYTGEIKLTNAAPTLYDNIAMNYKANKARFDELGITNPYLVVSFNGQKTTITDYTVNTDGQYVFTFYNIAPNQMDDTLAATLFATYGNGVYEGATLEYSVATYCYRMLRNASVVNNDAYAELRTLLVDLLRYGAAAQKFTTFAGETVDARLTTAEAAWGSIGTPKLESKTITNYATVGNPTASWTNVGLVLEDSVTMRFKFRTENIDNLKVKITSDTNKTGWVINSKDFQYEESTGKYYVDFDEFHAGQMRECVYVTLYNGNTAISNTLRYAIESYAYTYADYTSYPALAALVKAMMRYGDAAYAFAN